MGLRELLDRAEAGDAAAIAAVVRDASLAREAATDDETAFRHACIGLAHMLAEPAEYPDDAARERYSTLCERYGAAPARMARLKRLGEQLHDLEARGVLPRSMVVRSRRRRD